MFIARREVMEKVLCLQKGREEPVQVIGVLLWAVLRGSSCTLWCGSRDVWEGASTFWEYKSDFGLLKQLLSHSL